MLQVWLKCYSFPQQFPHQLFLTTNVYALHLITKPPVHSFSFRILMQATGGHFTEKQSDYFANENFFVEPSHFCFVVAAYSIASVS